MQTKALTQVYRFVFIAVLTAALMIVDHRSDFFQGFRNVLSNINTPFHAVLTIPVRVQSFVNQYWPNEKLRKRVSALEAYNLQLLAKVQQYDALEAEKNRLLVLFSASQASRDNKTRMGRIIRTTLQNSSDLRIVIDQGTQNGAVDAQAVIDANGVIGQISQTARDHSVITVITDVNHAIPVEVLRNGLHIIARGTGDSQTLRIPFLSFQADIEIGDVLVTSGLGDVFPAGHPVGVVTEIIGLKGDSFLQVEAKPFAELHKVKNVLLLEPKTQITPLSKRQRIK